MSHQHEPTASNVAKAAEAYEAHPVQAAAAVTTATNSLIGSRQARAALIKGIMNAALALPPIELTRVSDRVRDAVGNDWNGLSDADRRLLRTFGNALILEAHQLAAVADSAPVSSFIAVMTAVRDAADALD